MGGDARRIVANFGGRVELVAMGDVQRWAGRSSALLTFGYGGRHSTVYVTPAWLRVAGSDIRPQFRTLVAWDVLGEPTPLYPRWFVETPRETIPSARVSSSRGQVTVRVPCATTASVSIIYEIPLS